MNIIELNFLDKDKQKELLTQCCGATNWVNKMLTVFPTNSLKTILLEAEVKWNECNEQDWLEAFEHHPKIGDINSLKKKFANTAQWASNEQSGVNVANDKVLQALAEGNKDYEKKFGYIFIVCATGKTATEMLSILQARLPNDPADEIKIAAAEQAKITTIRLQKLFA
jgi:2-oxo-4-hydroxy-4-carboxy-5-ureidoimidazoline decarboxylase